jgi:TP53 regulating kinase-like protein
MIDFGLSSQAVYVENYAVDLYVLERAFGSTHPASEGLFAGVSLIFSAMWFLIRRSDCDLGAQLTCQVLEAYGKGMGKKWADIERRLKDGGSCFSPPPPRRTSRPSGSCARTVSGYPQKRE